MGREQTSGSITLDLGGVAASVAEHLAPSFDRIHRAIEILVSQAGISQQETADILQAFSPVVSVTEGRDLAARLAQAGYALVRVSDPAPAPAGPARTAESGRSFFDSGLDV